MSALRPIALVFAAAVVLAAPLRAQDSTVAAPPSAPAPAASSAAVAVGPTMDAATVAVRQPAEDAAKAAAPAGSRGHGQVLMIVGLAAVLTGIVIGNGAGYAISVAGAVVGLYGLYEYMQ